MGAELLFLDRNTGEEKFEIDQYAKDMFAYNEKLFVTDKGNNIICYKGENKSWKSSPNIKNFNVSFPVRDVLFNEKEVKLLDLKNGRLKKLPVTGDIAGTFSLLNEIAVLAKYKGVNELTFYSKADLKEKKKLIFKDDYKMGDVGFKTAYLVNEKSVLAIDIENKKVKWEILPAKNKKLLFTYSKGLYVYLFYTNNEIELHHKTSGKKMRTYILDKPREDALFTLYHKK